jgi:flagellar L-ring protein precursor FlgH
METAMSPLAPLACLSLLALLVCGLAACGTAERLRDVGRAPELTPVPSPATRPDHVPVAMPMPAPEIEIRQPNSLWQTGARAFFKDQRAARVGDILTVVINIRDSAAVNNTTARSRKNTENADLPNFLGFESKLGKVLRDAVDTEALVDFCSSSSSTGAGSVKRREDVVLTVAAVVTQVLPNGNLVIEGHQEVRVNFERRDLSIAGVVRPEDITNRNTITHTQIAEARIAYGGHGQLTDVQQPRYAQQVYDILFPF